MLHQVREQAEGAAPTFLLQRMSPFMAQSRSASRCDHVRFRMHCGQDMLSMSLSALCAFQLWPIFDIGGAAVSQCTRSIDTSESVSQLARTGLVMLSPLVRRRTRKCISAIAAASSKHLIEFRRERRAY